MDPDSRTFRDGKMRESDGFHMLVNYKLSLHLLKPPAGRRALPKGGSWNMEERAFISWEGEWEEVDGLCTCPQVLKKTSLHCSAPPRPTLLLQKEDQPVIWHRVAEIRFSCNRLKPDYVYITTYGWRRPSCEEPQLTLPLSWRSSCLSLNIWST